MRRKMALTWATPSSSLSVTGTLIVSSMVYVSGSGRLAGKLYLLHRNSDRPKELPKSLILRGPRSTQDKQGLCEGSDKGTVWVAEPVPVSGEKWGKGKEDMGTGNISINTAYIRASEAFRAFSGQ
jgi:hypothetical protein